MSHTRKTKPWWARARAQEIRYKAWHSCTERDLECDLPAEPQPRHARTTRCWWWPDEPGRNLWGRDRFDQIEGRELRRKTRHAGRRVIAEAIDLEADD